MVLVASIFIIVLLVFGFSMAANSIDKQKRRERHNRQRRRDLEEENKEEHKEVEGKCNNHACGGGTGNCSQILGTHCEFSEIPANATPTCAMLKETDCQANYCCGGQMGCTLDGQTGECKAPEAPSEPSPSTPDSDVCSIYGNQTRCDGSGCSGYCLGTVSSADGGTLIGKPCSTSAECTSQGRCNNQLGDPTPHVCSGAANGKACVTDAHCYSKSTCSLADGLGGPCNSAGTSCEWKDDKCQFID
jgi:hypothetical protein